MFTNGVATDWWRWRRALKSIGPMCLKEEVSSSDTGLQHLFMGLWSPVLQPWLPLQGQTTTGHLGDSHHPEFGAEWIFYLPATAWSFERGGHSCRSRFSQILFTSVILIGDQIRQHSLVLTSAQSPQCRHRDYGSGPQHGNSGGKNGQTQAPKTSPTGRFRLALVSLCGFLSTSSCGLQRLEDF